MDISSWPYILTIFCAFGGVILTVYIFSKKRRKQVMVCPLNGHCETVINSEFSRFFGIPVELLGMFYYGLVATAYAMFLVLPMIATPQLTVSVFLATTLAFLFSAYLVFIQVFYLRQLCTWCLVSAGLCTIIFAISAFTTTGTALLFILPYMDYVLSAYTLGLALGLGSVTFSALFLAKFLRDLQLSQLEADLIRLVSQVTWLALAMLFVTGSIAYIAPGGTHEQAVFSPIQIVILLITIGSAAVLELLITPQLVTISLQQNHSHLMGELRLLRRAALALSAVSLVSWYMGFFLGTVQGTWDFTLIASIYAALVGVGIAVSQVLEHQLGRPL